MEFDELDPIHPQPGSSLRPESFVGRARTTRIATNRLTTGTNLLLADPRRMGKSQWLHHFAGASQASMRIVVIDYEGAETSGDFLSRTVEALVGALPHHRRAWETVAAFMNNVEVTGKAGPVSIKKAFKGVDPATLFERTIGALANEVRSASEAGETRLVIAMDEVPIAILTIIKSEGPAAGERLLLALRRAREAHPEIGWIMCGSIGFHHVLRRIGTTEGVLNNLDNLPLGPLEDHEAEELAARLLKGAMERPTTEAVDALAEVCGRIPYLMHKLSSLLADAGGRGDLVARIEASFEAFVHDRDESRAVTHLVTRLDTFYEGADLDSAHAILDVLARAPRPHPRLDLIARLPHPDGDAAGHRVIDALCDDHYLEATGAGLGWRYDVLRRIWVARRGLV